MSSLNYSDFEPLNNNKKAQRKSKNQTLKNRKRENNKVHDFLQAIDNENDEDNLYEFNKESTSSEFNPQQYKDYSQQINNIPKNELDNKNIDNENIGDDEHMRDDEISKEAFNNLDSNYSNEYYKQFIPYYNQVSNSQEISGEKDVLLEKLNYMIHLLEEQQEEKTGHITEELILYCFLGVFIIFVVDSFARAGKYVR